MACELTAALWQRQAGWELGARGQGHSGRRDKLKEPLEKQPGPATTTTPQQGLQSSSRAELEGKEETVPLLDANRNQGSLRQRGNWNITSEGSLKKRAERADGQTVGEKEERRI